jgi:hypothetical protein
MIELMKIDAGKSKVATVTKVIAKNATGMRL